MTRAAALRAMLADGIHVAPGCFDGLSARLIEQAGFGLAYASGGAISRGAGMPDLGLMTARECAERMAQICDVIEYSGHRRHGYRLWQCLECAARGA